MLVEEHYLQLRTHFSNEQNREWIEVKLTRISEILYSTKRNTNILIKKMEDRNWIKWSSGRGRGKSSKIMFLKEKDLLLVDLAKHRVLSGDLHSAHTLLNTYNISNEGSVMFSNWMEQQLGYHQKESSQQQLDMLRFPFYRPIPFLDPAFAMRRTEVHIVKQVFDTLVIFNPKTKAIEPHLAHYWTNDETYKVWTFYLRKGIRFHHGKTMSSLDVAYTLQRIQNPKTESPHQWMVNGIKKITCMHEHAIQIELFEPNSLFVNVLNSSKLSIVPNDLHEHEEFSTFPVGTGPFSIKRNDKSKLLLQVNEYYFKERAHLDQIEIWIWPDFTVEQKLKSLNFKYLHITHSLRDGEGFNELNRFENESFYLAFNLHKQSPYQNVNFRKAFHLAINRTSLIEDLGGLRHKPASGFLSSNLIETYINDYDITKAREKLAQSGYAGETIHLYTYEMPLNIEDAQWIKRAAEKLGVYIEISVFPIEELRKKDVMMQADLIVAGEVFDANIEIELIGVYKEKGSFIGSLIGENYEEEIEELIATALKTSNKEQRLHILNNIENIIRNSYNVIFLYHNRQNAVHHDSLKGVSLNALGWIEYRELWLEK
ncbi:ABC transporter substrate-binding protein [Bacillus sp. SM2101]|uniref:ABC transporter substrate-binding protein n=1 Tax=Bacillus sp. SM2101 TaxID=2805366 RepID=UPI001BDE2CB8|nr:ABC transporter substrate-binding protein [Bacillus sp. SM2101]